MTKGMRTPLGDGAEAALVADYRAGMGINALRAKYGIGQPRVEALLAAAGVARRSASSSRPRGRAERRRAALARSAPLGRRPTAEEWGYLAGIFDGEGYLGYASRGEYFRLAIAQNADRGLHERLRAVLRAGRISKPQGGQPSGSACFHLESQRQIAEFCRGVLPFVMVKRPRVLEVLARWEEAYGTAREDA